VGDGRRNHALQMQAVTPPRAHGSARAAAAGSNGEEPRGAVRCHFDRRLYFSTRAPGLSFPAPFFLMHNVQGMLQRQNIHEGDITVVSRACLKYENLFFL
jgi:hypothetical protein